MPEVGSAAEAVFFLSAMGLGGVYFCGLLMSDFGDKPKEWIKPAGRRCMVIVVISFTVAVVLPSKTTMLALLGYNMAADIEGIEEISQEASDYLRALLVEETRRVLEDRP